jgi:glucokinase
MYRWNARNGTVGSQSRVAVGLDVGGTKIAGGVVASTGEVLERITPLHTPTDCHGVTRQLAAVVDDLRQRHPGVIAIGVGAAGLVTWPDGHVRWAPNNGYRDLPLRQLLLDMTGLPTVVDNDANAAAWAEARAAAGVRQMLLVTVGTGVGGGLLFNGQIYRARSGVSAEVGHMIVDPGGPLCGCGNSGCLEAVASGTALGRYGREAAAREPAGMLAQLGGGPAGVTGETVFTAARAGDPIACALYRELGRWLGVGLASVANVFDLEAIVVGGGVASAGDMLLEPCRTAFAQMFFAADHRSAPLIVPAQLGNDAGWIGAAILALEEVGDAGPIQLSKRGLAASLD